MKKTRLASLLISTVALVGAGVALGQPAQAEPITVTCLIGHLSSSYSPAMTNQTTTKVNSTHEEYSCSSLSAGVSSVSGGATFTVTDSCLLGVDSPTVVATYHWNTGQTSTVTYTITNAVRAADGTATLVTVGTVTQGFGYGSTVTRVAVRPVLDVLACSTTGLTTIEGPSTLTILPT